MNNADYWARRFKIMEDPLKNQAYDYAENLERQFDAAIADIDTQMRAWYQRFSDNNGGISWAEAQRLLTAGELKEFKWTVREYIKAGEEHAISGAWAKELENASARVHISRLESLKIRLRQQAEVLTQATTQAAAEAAELSYTESYYHTAFEVQRGFGVGWTMQGVNASALEKVLSRPWTADNRTFTARCWTDKAKLVETVNQELTRMIATGEAPGRAIETISKRFNVSKQNASRVVMTESAYFSSAAQKDSFKELGVERYCVVGTFDTKMCKICSDMDGKVFKMGEYSPGSTAPPFHPWCRCCTAPYFDDEFAGGSKAARGADGKTYQVPADMTYKEWKAKFVDEALNSNNANVIIEMYKGKGLDIVFNKEVSAETISKVHDATKKITSDFKSLENYSEPIKFGYVQGGIAQNAFSPSTGKNQITLLESAFADEKALLKQLNDDYLNGKSYKTDRIESLVAHEMGHNAHIALALKRAGIKYGNPLTSVELKAFDIEYKKIAQEIYIAAFTVEDYNEIQEICIEQLGDLTHGNANELIAQSFGNYYYGDKKSVVAKYIVNFFKKGLKK